MERDEGAGPSEFPHKESAAMRWKRLCEAEQSPFLS